MKKVLFAVLLVSGLAIAAISTDKKYKLNQYMGATARETNLGTLIDEGGQVGHAKDGHQPKSVLIATYDFSVDGGDSVSLPETLPEDAVITRSYIEVLTQPVTAGTGSSVVITTESSGDVYAETAATSLTTGFKAGVSDGTVSNFKKMTASRPVTIGVIGDDLSAGKIKVYLEYFMSE